jgi:hypothetical protein
MEPTTKRKAATCRERCHIRPFDFSLWDFSNAVCVARGVDSFILYPTTAAMQTKSSISAVKRAAKRLIADGWWEVIYAATPGRTSCGEYRVLNHEQWVAKYGQRVKGSACIYIDPNKPGAELIAA